LDPMPGADAARVDDLERQWAARMLATQDSARCRALIERLARNGTWQTPTLSITGPMCAEAADLPGADQLRYVPASMRAWWTNFMTGHDASEARPRCALLMRLAGELHRGGVPILAGTDAANPFVVWGFSLHEELRTLVRAGLSPLEALRS